MVSRRRTIDCRHSFDGMWVRVGVGCYPSDCWAEWTELPSNLGFQGSQIDFQFRQIQCRIMLYFLGTGQWNSASISFIPVPSVVTCAAFLLSLNHIHKRVIYPKVSLALTIRKWPLTSFPRRTSHVSRQTIIKILTTASLLPPSRVEQNRLKIPGREGRAVTLT